jgi:RND family efflux transporter MFP subunit
MYYNVTNQRSSLYKGGSPPIPVKRSKQNSAKTQRSKPGELRFPRNPARWRRSLTRGRVLALVWLLLSATGSLARAQSGEARYVTVRMAEVTPHLEAYGQVEPAATLTVSFAEAGEVAGMSVAPGAQVRAGEELARLVGPAIQSVVLHSQDDVRNAQAQLSGSQQSLAFQRRQLALHLGSGQAVSKAESAVAQARTLLGRAQSHLQAVRQAMNLTSPVDATVLMTTAANGEMVSAAQPILTLQTPYQLWLHAAYYGFDLSAIRAGMTGSFSPADGSESIPVRLCAVAGLLDPGGGASITLVPSEPTARWVDGEFGTVALNLPPRVLAAVPTRSLILDQGHWWVMVHTPQGDRPQAVVPGPSRGWETFLEQGPEAGTQVLVDNAYLFFHQDISHRYQPPD